MKANGYINFADTKCEEAHTTSRETYIPCGHQGCAIVFHQRDGKHTYIMCLGCADHNLRNRGGKLIATDHPEIAKRYGK